MKIDLRLLASALGLSLVLAACGGTSTATNAPSPDGDPTAAPVTEEPAVSVEPAATEDPAETDDPGTGAVNDLASLLPEKVGDVEFERVGYDGDQLGVFGAAAGLNSEELDPILKANNKTLSDINFAIATAAGDGASGSGGMIYAIQIEGLDAGEFAAGMGMDTSSMPKTTLGGKTVYGQAAGGFGAFAYPKDDKLFIVLLMDEQAAASVFEQLP